MTNIKDHLSPYGVDILFDRETHFIGRNGMGRCKGIQVRLYTFGSSEPTVVIEPLTSRLVCGNCQIVVDTRSISNLIRALKHIRKHIKKKGSK